MEYREIEVLAGQRLNAVVEELLEYKKRGKFVCAKFNDHMLYSDTVTMDSAYLEITGKSKADFDKDHEERRKRLETERELVEKAAQENIPNWIERGHKLLPEDTWEEWDKVVPIRASDSYHGMELDCTLQIQEILMTEAGEETFRRAKKCMEEQGRAGMSWSLVCDMVKGFCTYGEEFVKWFEINSLTR